AFLTQVPSLPALVLIKPLRLEPGDRVRRQAIGLLADQRAQGLLEVTGGNATQVEPGNQFLQTPGALQVRWQQVAVEANTGATAIPDVGNLDFYVADACLNSAFGKVPITHHSTAAIRRLDVRVLLQQALQLRLNGLCDQVP